MDRLHQILKLHKRRVALDRDCTDPAVWEELAAAYEAAGAPSNAASCRARAVYYAAEQEAEAVVAC